jgi:hypothetical protein
MTGAEMAKQWGVARYKFLDIEHPIANLTEYELDQRVQNLVEDVRQLFLEGQPG